MVIDFYDTSALLAIENIETFFSIGHNYISHFCLSELEAIKTSANKNEEIKARARKVARFMLANPTAFFCDTYDERKIEKARKKHFFPDNMDGRILAEATLIAKKNLVVFWTADVNMSIFAREAGLEVNTFFAEEKQEEPWAGWSKYYPNEQEFAMLYTDPKMNILGAKTNEYCVLYQDTEVRDVLRWDGEEYRKLKYKDMKNPYTQEIIHPRNLEQKLAFDMLQNQNIKVKVLYSAWGSGKTMLALTYALEQIAKGKYQKILFVRNNIICAATKDIGYLPSDLKSKMSIWNRNVADHVGGDLTMDELEEEGIIETFPLSHMRGRSLRGVICIADECENLTPEHITLLMSRIEEDSEIIFTGDGLQCDLASHKMMGMYKMIDALAGDPLFGVVKLLRSERGPVPRLCDKIIPPR